MKHVLIPFFVLVLFTSLSFGSQESYEYPAMITVTGYGVSGAEPDVATIVFGVDIIKDNPADAVEEAGNLIHDAMGAARDAGVNGEDMHTTGYNLWVQEVYDDYTYECTGELEYRVSHWVTLDVREIDTVGEVLVAIVNAGTNSISSVTFVVEDTSALYFEARENAAADARNKAQQLADNFGVELGEVQNISEWQSYYPGYDTSYYNYGGGYGEYGAIPPVTPGSYSVSLELSVTFELIHTD